MLEDIKYFITDTLPILIVFSLIMLSGLLVVGGLVFGFTSIHWQPSQEVVSGIAYNTSNDEWLSGNTSFSIRADVDTYVSEENRSSYCLPPNSPYKDLVNQAAQDKNIKLKVTANKYSPRLAKPWTCIDNVVVEKVEQ